MKKEYRAKLYTFFGLAILAVVIFMMSIFSKFSENSDDVRILGVHTTPTVKPTVRPTIKPTVKPTVRPTIKPIVTLYPTAKPTVVPTPFTGCVSNGMAVSNPLLCCSRNAVYIWSSYICGEVKTNVTVTPNKIPITPTISLNKPTIFVPTGKQTSCQKGTLDVECIDSSGRKCKWYKNEDCSWTCNQNCVVSKRCVAGKLDNICTNKTGQICYEYQNSDCSIDCSQNCRDKELSNNQQGTRSIVVQNTVNNVFKLVRIGSCTTGKDYNDDGTINSLDIVFCKNNSSQFSKNFNSVVSRINEGIPKLIDWVVMKMVGN